MRMIIQGIILISIIDFVISFIGLWKNACIYLYIYIDITN